MRSLLSVSGTVVFAPEIEIESASASEDEELPPVSIPSSRSLPFISRLTEVIDVFSQVQFK